jgi:hypothetical protein
LNEASKDVNYIDESDGKKTWLKNENNAIKARIAVLDHLIMVLKTCTFF